MTSAAIALQYPARELLPIDEVSFLMDPAALAEMASSSTFGKDWLERCGSEVGFDVAYHAHATGVVACTGIQESRLLPKYVAELLPIKRAALASGGVATDLRVYGARRDALAIYREQMAPEGGKEALFVVGAFRGEVTSVTMLGRTGSLFSDRDLEKLRGVGPVLGLAAVVIGQQLSPRDRDLSDYVALGFTNSEIAKALGLSPLTVRNRLSALYAKLGVANRAELVRVSGRS